MSEEEYLEWVTMEALARLDAGWTPEKLRDADWLHPDYRREVAGRMAELQAELAGVTA